MSIHLQKGANGDKHIKYASSSYRYFINLEKDERFMEDDYFVQLRLAGLNPMAIKKVCLEGMCIICISLFTLQNCTLLVPTS